MRGERNLFLEGDRNDTGHQRRNPLGVQILVFRKAVGCEDDRTIPRFRLLRAVGVQFHRCSLAEVGERLKANVVMEVVDKNPVKAVVIIVGESAVVVFEARDETAGILSDECEQIGFSSVSGTITIDMWLAQCPTLQLPYEVLKRIDHRLRKSGHVVLDVITGDGFRKAKDRLHGLLPGCGILDVLGEDPDGGSGPEHDGSDGVVMDEGSYCSTSCDVSTDDADSVE